MADSKAKQTAARITSKLPGTIQSSSNPRVLSRSELKHRGSPNNNRNPSIDISDFTAYKERPSTWSSFRSRLRARYAALPPSVRWTARVLRVIAPIVPIGIFFSEHVLQIMWVSGPSMTPYLNENYEQTHTESDVILVNLWPWGSMWPWNMTRRLERGMVVTFRSPANPSNIAIKRVIALPGDRVTTREPCPRPSQIVPFNHVWLEGDADDPKKSLDSNTYGPVSINLITGSVVAVLYPRMRRLKWWEWDPPAEAKSGSDTQKELGEGYRSSVRDRVVKQAVKIEVPGLD
ncbi:mitochondrial inner membrane protease subunit Imp2, putative [Talaromyces stipitatus ATCC 10500]|uniref:Mitochondrial inner membrane protease subunit Imp2, putative n=1 Tax=Talaromyces stipitatus (strain ATCC 10500 / CBS 375.48 / QM 6759 / NRRL 1006) TaxID=441959 RepID=B8M4X9_TALSN|nr:mitochondrial inner membrane protease subunit Imp2, putative [Talaromyces stipitatus ATCC 10500]EED19414.1 mitochondrial inner membrane protease subunit Imp2, putative [Talaromyces stipitatus ATCC 10500]